MASRANSVLKIISQEARVPIEELRQNAELEFTDLGVDRLLSESILNQVLKATGLKLPSNLFETCPTVGSLTEFLRNIDLHPSSGPEKPLEPANAISGLREYSKELLGESPLSIRLHGCSNSPKKTVFLLPDGSGSAMSYARIPSLGPDVCVYGLNSPFLFHPGSFLPIPDIAPIWAAEIRLLQPKGPYILGGWSAGGYYCFEVAKYLLQNQREDDGRPVKVEKLILIDSPSRNVFEALPMAVVTTLSNQGLMGNWGTNEAPKWLLDHFEATIARVEEYQPSPMTVPVRGQTLPKVFVIWATDGVYGPAGAAGSGLDTTVKVTQFMLENRLDMGPNGWDKLFPKGTEMAIATSPGTHFTLIFPPHDLDSEKSFRTIQRKSAMGGIICAVDTPSFSQGFIAVYRFVLPEADTKFGFWVKRKRNYHNICELGSQESKETSNSAARNCPEVNTFARFNLG